MSPYLRAGVEQEFAQSNETTINKRYRFDNNLNGTSGKYAAGLSVLLAQDTTLYGEMNYRQGSHIEDPVQGTLGLRIGF
ncbi:autotransporter outer membrane beta-barrel domain-containing protein [Citrobacter amalonaticus]|nr:autotransporter outer membrane beta-barrel domain-containing protein [Citrobacter amalonaticus]